MAYNKYNNKKTEIDGIIFDSKKEAKRYCELKLLVKAKKIKNLTLQPAFRLQPKFEKNGATIREIKYVADFMYTDENDKIVVEDVKGMKTDVYKIKKKMFEYNYPEYELIEV